MIHCVAVEPANEDESRARLEKIVAACAEDYAEWRTSSPPCVLSDVVPNDRLVIGEISLVSAFRLWLVAFKWLYLRTLKDSARNMAVHLTRFGHKVFIGIFYAMLYKDMNLLNPTQRTIQVTL